MTTPRGGEFTTGKGSGSVTTKGGSTVDYAGAGAKGTTGGGTNVGVGRGAVKVTGPDGQTYYRAGQGGAAQGPGGNTVASRTGAAATTGPQGTGAAAWHGAAASGPYGTVARGGAVATGPGGTAARFGTAVATPNYVAARGAAVRNGHGYYNSYFNRNWYGAHPGCWYPNAWATAAAVAWATPNYSSVATYCGCPAEPVSYDYGNTVVAQGDSVYVNGDQIVPADEYASQATAIADQGRQAKPTDSADWKPLGVFALVQGEDDVADNVFQLAIDKDGVVRGNYYDTLADNTMQVFGQVDKKSQRVAWSVGEKKTVVYEAGLSNLTKDQTTIMVHFGKDRSRQMLLVRLEKKPDAATDPAK